MGSALLRISLLITIVCGTAFQSNAQRKTKAKDVPVAAEDSIAARLDQETAVAEGMKFLMKDEPDRALAVFQNLVSLRPSVAATQFLLAKTFLKLDKLNEALDPAKKAYDLDKNNEFYAQQLGEIYAKKRKYNEAAEVYAQLVKNYPSNIQYGLELAGVYVFNDQYDKAIETYTLLEKTIGITEEITRQKQQLYLSQNKLEKALEEAKRLIASEPGEVSYRVELAELLIANDRLVEAVIPLEEALKINPDESQAHVLLADIYRKNGDIEKCNQELKSVFANPNLDSEPKIRVLSGYIKMLKTEKEYNDALLLGKQLAETHPGEARVHVIYADMLMRSGKKTQAQDEYLTAVRLDPSTFEVWGAILQLDGELNLPDSMLVHSEKALEVFPNQGMLWYSNGTAQLMKKNFKEAISSLEESLKLIGDRNDMVPFIYAQLGDAYNGLGDNQRSDASYDLALKANPENDHVLNNYSYFLSLRKEKLDLALSMSEKLVSLHKDNPTYLDTHAWVLYIRKDYKKAKEFLERAMKDTASLNGTIVEHYGDVLFKLGERENAVAQWKKAKRMGETTELLDKKIATGTLHE